jgi:hypothetical protein
MHGGGSGNFLLRIPEIRDAKFSGYFGTGSQNIPKIF